MTKPIVAVGLMMLYDKGLFDLYDPVERFIPGFKNLFIYDSLANKQIKKKILIIDLLRHTSGIGYGWGTNNSINQQYQKLWKTKNNKEFIDSLLTIPLYSNPGEEWRYGFSSDVCGYLIEVLSGLSLAVYLQNNIFDPLNMIDTHFELPMSKENRFISNYAYKKQIFRKKLLLIDSHKNSKYLNVDRYSGGSGLVSTSYDFLIFCKMLINKGRFNHNQLLKESTIDMMTINQIPHLVYPWGAGLKFGLGFSVVNNEDVTDFKSNNGTFGWNGVAGTSFSIDPEHELVTIIMTQRMYPWPNLFREFNDLVYASIIK
tara:strand:- start:234 stop:1178 length:945 start_codon:yes stop_codon:yes gene_type:complete